MIKFFKVFKDVKEFTVDRSKWIRGKGGFGSALLTHDDKKCCLGFYAVACGFPEKHLKNTNDRNNPIPSPVGIPLAYKGYFWDSFLLKNVDGSYFNSEMAAQMMGINDSNSLSDSEREERLTEIFNKHGVKVTFIN